MSRNHNTAHHAPAARRPHTQQKLEYRAILDAAVDAILVIDHEGWIQEFSRAAERVFGYRRDEIVGHNVAELMPEPYRSQHDGYLQRYLTSREPRIIGVGREVMARRKDGTVFPCDLAVGQVQGIEPPRFIGFIRDITDRKAAEEQLLRSETELKLAQDLAGLGNYVLFPGSPEHDYLSPQLYRILDAPPDTTRPTRAEYLTTLVHPADRSRIADAFARMDDGQPLDIEYQVVHQDGAVRYLHHLAQAVRDPAGRIAKYVGTVHDITDRRRAEDEARVLQERLTQRIGNSNHLPGPVDSRTEHRGEVEPAAVTPCLASPAARRPCLSCTGRRHRGERTTGERGGWRGRRSSSERHPGACPTT